jgi:hypothetical protein
MRVLIVVTPTYDVSAILLEVSHREQGAPKRNGESDGKVFEREMTEGEGKEVRSAELLSYTVKGVLFDSELSDSALID